MICQACKKYIEKEIAFHQGKTVNCMADQCKTRGECSRYDIVKYCLELIWPKEDKKDG